MLPKRVELQVEILTKFPEALVGTQFQCEPKDALQRESKWLNSLNEAELMTQRFKECTIILPTWAMTRLGGATEKLGEDADGESTGNSLI